MTLGKSQWYGVRSIWRHEAPSDSPCRFTYEERIVLYLAFNGDDAIAKAERDGYPGGAECIGYHMSFEIDSVNLGPGTELFSLMRDSDLDATKYIDRFHDSGHERTR
ncbi:hypothetical protein [Crateriforma conspicua]|uniref:DUF4288 domain-containing protein n=1 Tax=Crateriforma conspicua TaxID=2527996 RepID=A0A5C5XP18_9PLAN|nr:hypothetical protein [Crateriforma conspicua]TWT64956.1 hypothetical protein Pan14r_54580 [Crateriforma conspicua]